MMEEGEILEEHQDGEDDQQNANNGEMDEMGFQLPDMDLIEDGVEEAPLDNGGFGAFNDQ